MRSIVRAALAAALVATPAAAQPDTGPNAGAEVRGVVRPVGAANLGLVPAPHRPAVERTLRQLLAATLGSAVLQPPVGYDLGPTLRGYVPYGAAARTPPLAADVTAHIFWQTYQPGLAQVAPTPVSMAAFHVITNDVAPIWNGLEKWAKDAEGQMYWEPTRDGERGGFPYFSTDVVVITRIPRPLTLPVSRERVLRHELAEHRRQLAALPLHRTDLRTDSEGCIAEVERRLAALSAAERAEPAHLSLTAPPGTPRGRPRCTFLVDANALHARRIAVANPHFFDPSLPSTAVQLIIVDHMMLGKRNGRGWRLAAAERIRNELDYAAIATVLDGP